MLGLVLLAGAAYFALFGGDHSLLELRRIRQETVIETGKLAQLEQEITALRARADSLEKNDAAIERVARERWGLIRPGERLYRFADDDAPDTPEPRKGSK